MTLKRIVERGEKVETFEVLQIYMILKLRKMGIQFVVSF